MHNIPLFKADYGKSEEQELIQSLRTGALHGDGPYTKKVQGLFEERYQVKKTLFTPSCTDALELAALLADVQPGDEVIVPSYTFSSTALAFVLRGAKIVFIDSQLDHPNLSVDSLQKSVTAKTKVIVPMHYAGIACDMEKIMEIAAEKNILVVTDAAQAIDASYNEKSTISYGHLATLSFHQTKNISCGEGGMLVINDLKFSHRAEILREKGTNRSAFFRGEVDKYTCVDIGSSYVGSDLNAALLLAQMNRIDEIQSARLNVWQKYHSAFQSLKEKIDLPKTFPNQKHNAHCYYLVCKSLQQRSKLIEYLKSKKIGSTFHYISLHKSPYFSKHHPTKGELPNADRFTDCLLRLPLYSLLSDEEIHHVTESVLDFFRKF